MAEPLCGAPVTGLAQVGYQGHTLTSLLAELAAAGVSRLVDVRLNAVSRKPGFSKTALREALAGAGIVYSHWPELGNPKANRAGFGGTAAEVDAARAAYAGLLTRPAAMHSVDRLVEAARAQTVALLCFEADVERCHRLVLLHTAWMRAQPPGGPIGPAGMEGI